MKKNVAFWRFVLVGLLVVSFTTVSMHAVIPAEERTALIALYNETKGDNWKNNGNWKKPPLAPDGFASPGTEHQWYGITVSGDHVIIVRLKDNNLSGRIPTELGNLSNLQFLDLRSNRLIGSISTELGNLGNLKYLFLGENGLSGTIPQELGDLSNLENLELSDNLLSGTIPKELGNLTKLKYLYLDKNWLSGIIPKELGTLSQLNLLDLSSNELTGSLTLELGNLSNLEYLHLDENRLSGTIPTELENLSNLKGLSLSANQLSGRIPKELGNISNLEYLFLHENQLTGSIPTELGNQSQLYYLNLRANLLNGSIPAELGNLNRLEYLLLDQNQLSGTIPAELGNLSDLTYLYLYNNRLSGSIPGELGNLSELQYLSLSSNQLSGTIPPELGNLFKVQYISLNSNMLNGSIPAEMGNLSNLRYLYLYNNQLSGMLPSELGNLSNLEILYLDANQLTGQIPSDLINLTHLRYLDIGYNSLYTDDDTLREFLNTKDPNWEITQTTAPTQTNAAANSTTSIKVSWPSIPYIEDTGGYEVYYSTNPEGPYTIVGKTPDKSTVSYDVTGLLKGTTYYFKLKTWTNPHNFNSNPVVSEESETVSAATKIVPEILVTTVESSPIVDVPVSTAPTDINGNGDGTTNFERYYREEEEIIVTLEGPSIHNERTFSKWRVDGTNITDSSVEVKMDRNLTAVAYYGLPPIVLNREKLNFGYVIDGTVPGSQSFIISSSSGGILNWAAGTDVSWIKLNPSQGTCPEVVSVSLKPPGLSVGTHTGVVTISDPNASNSPQTVNVTLNVFEPGTTKSPFGGFITPLDGSTVSGTIPVTGWALDDIEVKNVKIYRGETGNLKCIGETICVVEARPKVGLEYPNYPRCSQAGWGYLMETNLLPHGGNGTFKIHAIATDNEGDEVTLGTSTITCDNANAVKPFGAIDTPTQGGTASGSYFVNYGWALTPQPNTIPKDGSTITVWVDGVLLGNPAYSQYRKDIAELFPGYNNSNEAGGYYYLDTTPFEKGLHTIAWFVKDDAGNQEGIGCTYFSIQNPGISGQRSGVREEHTVSKIPVENSIPVKMRKRQKKRNKEVIEIKELERFEVLLSNNSSIIAGYMLVGNQRRPLPVGTTLDTEAGIFYWQPGPGFIGEYSFIFIEKESKGKRDQKNITLTVKILPKFGERSTVKILH